MADFLEERISRDIKMGSGFDDQYAVNIVQTSGGNEYRSLVHPFPARTFDVSFLMSIDSTYNELLAMWHRAHGQYAGFRIRCYDEYSSNGRSGTPTHLDQPTLRISSGVYQLVKQYGTSKAAGASGYPYRQIKKPVSGTAKIGVNGTLTTTGVSVDYTTGRVTITPAPLITDVVTCGYEFDFPVRFNSSFPVGQDYTGHRNIDSVELIEILNP